MTEEGPPDAVLLFGASGFLGRNLVSALSAQHIQVIGVNRGGADVPGCDYVVRIDALDELPPLPAETVVINVAAHRYDAQSFRQRQSTLLLENSSIATRVYHFCALRGIREVRLASSIAVYAADKPQLDDTQPIDLNTSPHPGEAAYAWSKRWSEICADLYRQQYDVHTLTFRLSNPYGPYDTLDATRAHVIPALIMRVLSDAPAVEIRDPNAERDFVYVSDVVEIFRRSLSRRNEHDKYNVASGSITTIEEVARLILAAADSTKELIVGSASTQGVQKRRPQSMKLEAAFGIRPTRTLEVGLRETVAWYRNAMASPP